MCTHVCVRTCMYVKKQCEIIICAVLIHRSRIQSCSDADSILSSLLSKHNRFTSRAKSQAAVLFEFPICRLDVQLKKVETDQGFTRWLSSSNAYCDVKRLLNEKEKERRKEEISKCARERWFLVSLKAKFAGL